MYTQWFFQTCLKEAVCLSFGDYVPTDNKRSASPCQQTTFTWYLTKKKKAHANSFNSYFTVGLCVLDTIFVLFNFIGLFTDTEEQRVRIWTLCLEQCHRCEGRSAPYGNNWSLSKLDKGHWAAANILKLTWPPQTHLRPMGTKSNRPLSNDRILLENPHLDVSKAELNFVKGVPNVVG